MTAADTDNALAKKAKKRYGDAQRSHDGGQAPMRLPRHSGLYSDTQLQAIQKSLEMIGVSRLTPEIEKSLEMIGIDVSRTPEMETEVQTSSIWSYLARVPRGVYVTQCERLLALIVLFTQWSKVTWPTPKQRATLLMADIEKLEAAYGALGNRFIPPFLPEDPRFTEDEVRALATSHHVARQALREQIAYRRRRHDALVRHSSSSGNAKKKHVQFWQLLTQFWQQLPATKPRRHKHLQEFLRACSAPLYPKATTDKALTAFVERNFPQTS